MIHSLVILFLIVLKFNPRLFYSNNFIVLINPIYSLVVLIILFLGRTIKTIVCIVVKILCLKLC